MSEHLIDYRFGLLADDERAAFESLMTADRRLSAELDMLRRPLAWLAADVALAPLGVFLATLVRAFQFGGAKPKPKPCKRRSPARAYRDEPPPWPRNGSAGGLCLMSGLLPEKIQNFAACGRTETGLGFYCVLRGK